MSDANGPGSLTGFMKDEAKKWVARVSFGALTVVLIAAATPLGFKLRAIWNSPEQLQQVDHKIDEIAATLLRITGENRVIDQPDGMSYVREPVTVGQPIVLVLFIGVTEVGAGCIQREIIPIFTDENDVQRSGAPRRASPQLQRAVARRDLRLDQPGGLVPGRTRVQLQVENTCGGETVFEMTRPVFYYALPA